MRREMPLVGGLAVVLLVLVLVVAAVPGVLADPAEDRIRAGHVSLTEVGIAPGAVSGESATLSVDTRITHFGGPADNVSVEVRALDAETGFLEASATREVGTLTGERELSVPTNLTVAREGGYRIETVVYRDGRREDSGGKLVQGVGTLTPAYARTSIEFHRFDAGTDLPVITFSIAEAGANRTTLNASAYLTNTGDEPAGDLQLTFRARQVDSNIVADERTVTIGEIRPGRTERPGVGLVVPSGYNYRLDAILVKDGVIVGTASAPAALDPSETIPENETRRDVGLRVSDFEEDRDEERRPEAATPEAGASGPGFGVLAGVLALLAVAALARRHQ